MIMLRTLLWAILRRRSLSDTGKRGFKENFRGHYTFPQSIRGHLDWPDFCFPARKEFEGLLNQQLAWNAPVYTTLIPSNSVIP